MALGSTSKLSRALTFLAHVRHPDVVKQLATRGFDDATLEEGWRLFSTAAGRGVDLPQVADSEGSPEALELAALSSRTLIERLDAWENAWFPIIDATLRYRFPLLHQWVFHRLRQTSGPEVVITVRTMLDRIARLEEASDDGEPEAVVLLTRRGVHVTTLAHARQLLGALEQFDRSRPLDHEAAERAAREQALAELHIGYREWTQIARVVLTRGDLLVRLGLRSPRGKNKPVASKSSRAPKGKASEQQAPQEPRSD